ncbi:unnamed protein product, partial [Vitis vinifera]|uniref:Uncharacterized protein n=1 Tax=Vitis vinifera TaxID=29760 RepID=D7TYV3_VITVI
MAIGNSCRIFSTISTIPFLDASSIGVIPRSTKIRKLILQLQEKSSNKNSSSYLGFISYVHLAPRSSSLFRI